MKMKPSLFPKYHCYFSKMRQFVDVSPDGGCLFEVVARRFGVAVPTLESSRWSDCKATRGLNDINFYIIQEKIAALRAAFF